MNEELSIALFDYEQVQGSKAQIRPLSSNFAAEAPLLRSLLLPPAVSYLNAEPELPSLPTVVGSNIPITAFRQAARQLRGTTFFSLAPQAQGRSIRLWRWDELGQRVIDYDQYVAQICSNNYWTKLDMFVSACVFVLLVFFVQLYLRNTDARKGELLCKGLHSRG